MGNQLIMAKSSNRGKSIPARVSRAARTLARPSSTKAQKSEAGRILGQQ